MLFPQLATSTDRKSLLADIQDDGKRTMFTPEDDKQVRDLVNEFGTDAWHKISAIIQTKNARQCRERWKNYLSPTLRSDAWTIEEDETLKKAHAEHGTRWSLVAMKLPGRSENSVRNRMHIIERRDRRERENAAVVRQRVIVNVPMVEVRYVPVGQVVYYWGQ